MSRLYALAAFVLLSLAASSHAAKWEVGRVNHMTITPPAGVDVREMSGVTYVGPVGEGLHRFLAVQENHGVLTQFDVAFDPNGGIASVSNFANVSTGVNTQDFEGIAYTNATRNSVFLADESPAGPNVRELNLATGTLFQTLTVPAVIKDNERSNRGFESLTRTPDGTTMWAATQEALTVDGPVSTSSVGSVVRLLRFDVSGKTVTTGPQYAYLIEPIHSTIGSQQSGLADLASMPDGTVITLERSLAVASPLYLTRIYELDFAGATDVSVGALGAGLIDQTYTTVSKTNIYTGAIDGASGQNMEGLTLGPRLANGSWVMLGVVDNGDPGSMNTLVAFTATANVTGDFDGDGDADGSDFLAWQLGLGKTVGAKLSEGDGDRDGDVDAADLAVWQGAFVMAAGVAVPEPNGAVLAVGYSFALAAGRRRVAVSR